MFNLKGTTITISQGDTGAVDFHAKGYNFGENDRALFTLKSQEGVTVKEGVYPLVDGTFTVYFLNADTDSLPAGTYYFDVRYIINPYYNEAGRIVDGDQVITPRQPMTFSLMKVIGQI